jgi:hypothetical protein
VKVEVGVTVGEGVRLDVALGAGGVLVGAVVGLAVGEERVPSAVAVVTSGGSVEVGLAAMVTTALGVRVA